MLSQFIVSWFTIFLIANVMLLACAYLIFLERKVSAWAQDRIGPNRTNFSFGVLPFRGRHFGLGQALADGLKLMLKEDYDPPNVDRVLFMLAPALAVVPALLGWAVIPWGGQWMFPGWGGLEAGVVTVAAAPISIGVVYILAISSLAVYGVVVGAYASNNKYSFLGGLRATAQMLSYEIPMGLIVLILILTYRTTDTSVFAILQVDWGYWGIFTHPLLGVIFFTCILAETNRAPFDLAEAEQELVGGFHTEYSSMKWALFFLAEYMHMITGSAFFAVLFLGGWSLNPISGLIPAHLPIVGGIGMVVAKVLIFFAKVTLLLFAMMWVRWTLPRLRFDQLMKLAWRSLIPITLVMLLVTGVVIFLEWPLWALTVGNVVVAVGGMYLSPRLPQGPGVNRRIPLRGSRFNPPPAEPAPT